MSALTADNAAELLARADGGSVGTAVKRGGETANPVDPARARVLVEQADTQR